MENNVASLGTQKTVCSGNKHDGEDSEEDEDRDEPVTVATSVADSCSASHEFEWLSPGYQSTPYSNQEKQNEKVHFSELSVCRQQPVSLEESSVPSCQVSPARSAQHRHHKLPQVWPRKSIEISDQTRMSPSPCHELHSCHRHLSPMRSSWCCPSSSPHSICLHHHGGSMLSGLELVSFNRECYGPEFWPCQNCSCLPPTGLTSQSRYQESHSWCRNPSPQHEIIRRESSSPCGTHKSCQGPGGSRTSRSTRKRDCLSPLSPRYSPVPADQTASRHSGHDQWQVPLHSEDIESLRKLQELENDKKSLLLQANVLAVQVDAQTDKIIELERLLQQKKEELLCLEQNLHQEIIGRSTLENNKLELMTELTNLRLRLTAAERDRKESDDKCRKLEHELSLLQARLFEKETEHTAVKDKLLLHDNRIPSNEGSEIEKVKFARDSIVATDKDQKLEDLQSSLTKYKKLHDMIVSSHSHLQKTSMSGSDLHIFNHESVTNSANNDVSKKIANESNAAKTSHVSQPLSSVSTSYHEQTTHPQSNSCVKVPANIYSNSVFQKSNSVENICPSSLGAYSPKNQYGTMPRQSGLPVPQLLHAQFQENDMDQMKKYSLPTSEQCEISNNDTSKIRSNVSGSNNKNIGVSFAAECITIPVEKRHTDSYLESNAIQSHMTKPDRDKNKGLLKFFSKQDIFKWWKRTGSQNIEGEFRRGGIRATAGPRLGWSHDIKIDPDIPFICWNADMIIDWFHKLGLTMYIGDCKRWMCNGEILTKASSQDLEKELHIKHPLHRKKLLLAIKSMNSGLPNLPSSIHNIDSEWVFRWLDDIGLPQYKDAFTEALVDGRMLHTLTMDDLVHLKVTSQLHHISIKCGIQVLREKGFNPQCLVRRSIPEEDKIYTPEMVALWTNHRVMEWLRTVEMSEYAPNLRGSGVHGALIVYEPRFNTNLFATLLNIPPTKTLLRRHLATHFRHIVGDELMQMKRLKETEIPLSPSVKIKVLKKNQFVLKKKRNKSDLDNEEYVCPMDIPVCHDQPNQVSRVSEGEKLIVRRNSDPSPQERHLDLQNNAAEKIEAVSKEISSLTTMLQGDSLSCVPSTTV